MKQTGMPNIGDFSEPQNETRGNGSRHIERREWWLLSTAIAITLLLTLGIASFLPVLMHSHYDWEATLGLRQAVWGLLGMVLLFDLYTIYQQLQIHRIRRQLAARDRLFRLITENAADMIAVVDTEGKRIYNSLSYQKVLGYSPAELQQSSSFEQIHPDDRERVAAAGAEARRTGKGEALEYRMRHKDGTWRVLESTSSVILSRKGEPDLLVIVNRDVTGRKQAEDALRAEHDLLRTLIDNMPDLIYVKDAGSRLVLANRALAGLMGAKNPEDLLGKTDFDYFPKELATAYFSDEQAILQSGQPLVNQEERVVDAEGNAKWLSTSKVPLSNRQGEVHGIIGIGRDITVRRQAEEALRLSETSFRSVVEGAPYGIFRASVDGRFLQVNSALQEMLGYRSSTDLLDANLGDHVFRNRADFRHLVGLLDAAEEFKNVEMEWKRKDGSPITVLCSGRRVEGGDENSTYNEVFVEDITERRVLERQLRMAAKMEAVGQLSG